MKPEEILEGIVRKEVLPVIGDKDRIMSALSTYMAACDELKTYPDFLLNELSVHIPEKLQEYAKKAVDTHLDSNKFLEAAVIAREYIPKVSAEVQELAFKKALEMHAHSDARRTLKAITTATSGEKMSILFNTCIERRDYETALEIAEEYYPGQVEALVRPAMEQKIAEGEYESAIKVLMNHPEKYEELWERAKMPIVRQIKAKLAEYRKIACTEKGIFCKNITLPALEIDLKLLQLFLGEEGEITYEDNGTNFFKLDLDATLASYRALGEKAIADPLFSLKQELADAIEGERYEEAAKIRDQIRAKTVPSAVNK